MSEIEKLYRLAGCKKIFCDCAKCKKTDCINKYIDQDTCVTLTYSPFTAEKQLELIKWLIHRCFYLDLNIMPDQKSYGLGFKYQPSDEYKNEQSECCTNTNFSEVLAACTQIIWHDLTKTEQKEIREILEG